MLMLICNQMMCISAFLLSLCHNTEEAHAQVSLAGLHAIKAGRQQTMYAMMQ